MSLVDIHEGTFDKSLVKGKIVLVAVTAIGTFDQRVTPFSPNVPGVEVHAAAVQNMVDGRALKRPTFFLQVEMLVCLLVALAFGIGNVVAAPPSPDAWVVGYGLDYADRYRTLPFIAELKPEVYRK